MMLLSARTDPTLCGDWLLAAQEFFTVTLYLRGLCPVTMGLLKSRLAHERGHLYHACDLVDVKFRLM